MRRPATGSGRPVLAALIVAGLAFAAPALADPIAASAIVTAGQVSLAPGAAPLAFMARTTAPRHAGGLQHLRDLYAPQAHAGAAARPVSSGSGRPQYRAFAEPRTNGLTAGAVHYDYGPTGLDDDVSTFGITHRF